MSESIDYSVDAAVHFTINKSWDDNDPDLETILDNRYQAFEGYVQEVFADSHELSYYIVGTKENVGPQTEMGLDFSFDGPKVCIEFTFECADESASEAESFVEFCVKKVQNRLEEFGGHITGIETSATMLNW